MKKNIFNRLLSLLLCFTFIVSCFGTIKIKANEMDNIDFSYAKVNEKIVSAFEDGTPAEDIFLSLSQDEVQILYEHYSVFTPASALSLDNVDNDEIAYVDALANLYYNELITTGGTEDLSNMSWEEINEVVENLPAVELDTKNRVAGYYDPSDYCAVIKKIGNYNHTLDEISRQLVSVGVCIKLGSPLPFIELAGIIAGAFIVTLSIAVLYCASAIAANELLYLWYARSISEINAANRITAQLVAEEQSGVRFWRAYLANFGGLGGVSIGTAITPEEALYYTRENQGFLNVFCMYYSDAVGLAEATFGSGHIQPDAHRGNGKVLNMQHVHARTPDGAQGFAHIFFAIPYLK